jgi:hypothetical protein
MKKVRTVIISVKVTEEYEDDSLYAEYVEKLNDEEFVDHALSGQDVSLPYETTIVSGEITSLPSEAK